MRLPCTCERGITQFYVPPTIGLGARWNTEVVCPTEDGHLSQYYRKIVTFSLTLIHAASVIHIESHADAVAACPQPLLPRLCSWVPTPSGLSRQTSPCWLLSPWPRIKSFHLPFVSLLSYPRVTRVTWSAQPKESPILVICPWANMQCILTFLGSVETNTCKAMWEIMHAYRSSTYEISLGLYL